MLYANFGVRGRLTRRIRDEQLPRALALRPDLATLFCGSNDILERRFDAGAFESDVRAMQAALVAGGATVVSFTFPDLEPVFSLARPLRGRVLAMNAALRAASAVSGAILVDFAQYEVASDPRMWSEDRYHANAAGHERIAHALAHAIGIPGADESWQAPLPESSRPSRMSRWLGDCVWASRYAVGWGLSLVAPRGAEVARKGKQEEWVEVRG